MKEQELRRALNAAMNACPPPESWKRQVMAQTKEGKGMKTRISAAFVLAVVMILLAATAVAAALLSAPQVVEQVAVPLARQNDQTDLRQGAYTHEELAQLIKTLNENGITLEEDSQILRALKMGLGYWEDETIMEICRQAFGGSENQWTIEEKYWFENMMGQIGFSDRNAYLLPADGDFTVPQARAHAAALLKDAYGVSLPADSDDTWRIDEWLYAPVDGAGSEEPAYWAFEYVRRKSGQCEYAVRFLRDGALMEMEEAGFHGEMPDIASFSMADRLMGDRYGSPFDWPLEAWVQFGGMIAHLTPKTQNQWLYQQAGYCLPPEGGVSPEQAVLAVRQAAGREGDYDLGLLCCTDADRRIYKVNLRYATGALPLCWCGEVDCLSGQVLALREYSVGTSPMMMQFAPFSLLDAAPDFAALDAITAQLGPQALDALGAYQVGAICCRYPESDGIRIAWEIYVTTDPVLLSNGYRVNFDDPAGVQALPTVEVQRANAENG